MPVFGEKVFHIYVNVINNQIVKGVDFCLNVFKY